MRRSPSDIDSGSPADNGGVSFTVLLAGGFLVFLGAILVVGVFGPMIGLGFGGGPASPTPTPPATLGSANAPEVPKADSSASLDATEVARIERMVVAYANAERTEYNHTPLIRNNDLANISRAHSYDMVQRGYFDHYDPDGHGPGYRAQVAGYTCPAVSENIANIGYQKGEVNLYGGGFRNFTTPREWAKAVVGRWMKSGGHRWAILSPKYDIIGVGVYARGDDQVFATMMVCDRRNWPDTPPEGMDAPVADPGVEYNESYWEPYPDDLNASWDDDPPTHTPSTEEKNQ